MIDHFIPCPARARDLRAAMERALWDSVGDVLADPDSPCRPLPATGEPPGAGMLEFGAYFDLTLVPPQLAEVPAAARDDAVAHLRQRLAAMSPGSIAHWPDGEGSPRITNFSLADHPPHALERMRRWWDIEPANHMGIAAASPAAVERSCGLVATALDHLRAASPALHDEIRIIVRDIVLSHPDGNQHIAYGGASSFALWGGVLLNTASNADWMQVYRKIVHEAAHNLLFAIARSEPLIEDDPAERHASPIRADLRPMDGIFHAAFVSAREAMACDDLLCLHEREPRLDVTEVEVVTDLLDQGVLAFWDCTEQLRGHGRLTALGEAVLGDCETWMHGNFSVVPA